MGILFKPSRNLTAKGGIAIKKGGRTHRTAEVRVSDEDFPRVAEVTRRFLSSFIESSDRQLLAAVEPDPRLHSAHRRRWCGVTAFVFRDP